MTYFASAVLWSFLYEAGCFDRSLFLCSFYSDSMKPGGWWTSCGRVLWLITMPVLGWQSPPRYVPANPLIRQSGCLQAAELVRSNNSRSLCAFPSMLPRVTLLCWTIQPSAAFWSRRPVPHLRSTRVPRLLLWSSPSPSPSHSKVTARRGTVRQCGEKMEASKSADLDATQAKWVQVVAVEPARFSFVFFFFNLRQYIPKFVTGYLWCAIVSWSWAKGDVPHLGQWGFQTVCEEDDRRWKCVQVCGPTQHQPCSSSYVSDRVYWLWIQFTSMLKGPGLPVVVSSAHDGLVLSV